MIWNLYLKLKSLSSFTLPSFCLQAGIVLVSISISSLFYHFTTNKLKVLQDKNNFKSTILTTKTCYLFSLLLSVSVLVPAYIIYANDSIPVIFLATILILTIFIMRVINSIFNKPVAHYLSASITLLFLLALSGFYKPIFQTLSQTNLEIGVIKTSLLKLIESVALIVILAWGVRFISKKVDHKLDQNKHLNKSTTLLLSKLNKAVLIVVSGFFGISITGIDLSIFTFFAGALGVGIAFGLKNITSNLFSGVVLLIDRSVKLGDVIAIKDEGAYGVVHKLSARFVSVRTREGIEHLIPNEKLIDLKIENWTHSDPLIRVGIDFHVGLNTDINFLEQILLQIAGTTQRVLKEPAPSIRVTDINTNCIEAQLRVWISDPEKGKSSIKSDIYRQALIAFKKGNIEIPLPPLELYFNRDLNENKLSQKISQQKISQIEDLKL